MGEKELKNIVQRKSEEKVQKRKQQQRKEATILQETSTNSNNGTITITIIIIITVQSHITERISEELEARKTSCSNTHNKDNEKGKRSKIPYKEIVCDCVMQKN